MLMPNVILLYWRGPVCQWRNELTSKFRAIYPDAEFVQNVSEEAPEYGLSTVEASDIWRYAMCATRKRCLWIDNDMELPGPLPLTEKPAMAHEYGSAHHSIIWSGDNPGLLFGPVAQRKFNEFVRKGLAELITPEYFTHWATDRNGNKAQRGTKNATSKAY